MNKEVFTWDAALAVCQGKNAVLPKQISGQCLKDQLDKHLEYNRNIQFWSGNRKALERGIYQYDGTFSHTYNTTVLTPSLNFVLCQQGGWFSMCVYVAVRVTSRIVQLLYLNFILYQRDGWFQRLCAAI